MNSKGTKTTVCVGTHFSIESPKRVFPPVEFNCQQEETMKVTSQTPFEMTPPYSRIVAHLTLVIYSVTRLFNHLRRMDNIFPI